MCHQEGSGKPGGLEIKWNTSALIYADDVSILGGSIHIIRKNTEALLIASKDIGLEVNAEKNKYMIMSRDKNAGQNIGMKVDNEELTKTDI